MASTKYAEGMFATPTLDRLNELEREELKNIDKTFISPRDRQVGGDHYLVDKACQPFQIARAYNLSAELCTAVKYVVRNKGGVDKKIEDLNKAIHCIQLEIEELENES